MKGLDYLRESELFCREFKDPVQAATQSGERSAREGCDGAQCRDRDEGEVQLRGRMGLIPPFPGVKKRKQLQ